MHRVLALLVLVLAAGMAGGNVQRGSDAQPADPGAEHRRIVEHWTRDRQADAIDRDVLLADGPGRSQAANGAGTTTSAPWVNGGPVTITTGRVFFTEGRFSYSCTGSVADSGHGSLVLTAGHCVHGGGRRGSFVTNWIFFPGWTGPDDVLPVGSWTATDLFTTAAWSSFSNFDDDAGFAVVTGSPGEGTLEVELANRGVAAPVLAFGSPAAGDHITSFGYPAAKKSTGNVLTFCDGSVETGLDGKQTIAMPCDMPGGSSGGPWFGSLPNAPGNTGTIRSLVSYGYASMKDYLFGPILDGGEQAAYAAASSNGDCGAATPSGYACSNQAA